ncbi:MAG: magnesium/cobalt transporter CorA [Flavobacteriales bacterium]|nr:magnesium/cobalt transporter CorA [Flavobacteriales bacterium]
MSKRPLKKIHRRSRKKGLLPGSLIYVGNAPADQKVQLRLFDYNNASFNEILIRDITQCAEYRENKNTVTWLDIDGIHNAEIMEEIGKTFEIHPLVLEDIMNASGRPKVEFFDDYTFLSTKMIEFSQDQSVLTVEHFCIIIGDSFLLTFQENRGDNFDSVRERIRTAKGKVRGSGPGYLAYMLLDVVVDNYIVVSENIADEIEELEEMIMSKPAEIFLHRILELRKELMDFKKGIDPLREAINTLKNELDPEISKYYRDLYDHIVHETENLNVYRDTLSSLMDLYHSSITFKTNVVMKMLTIITTIFVPLTFIVGVYGMNFSHEDPDTGERLVYNMPELYAPYGYPIAIGCMLMIVLGMLFYFRKKEWL